MTDTQRATFAALADLLIPAAHGMPAASAIGLSGAPLDRVLRARPDLEAPLCSALDALPKGLDGATPAQLDLLLLVAGCAYTADPRIKALLGYPGQDGRSLPRAGFGAEDLAMVMMERPPMWRPAP